MKWLFGVVISNRRLACRVWLGRWCSPGAPSCQFTSRLQRMELALMFPWARISALYQPSLPTNRWKSQSYNFPFPNRDLILRRCLALLVLCKELLYWWRGTSRHLARGSAQYAHTQGSGVLSLARCALSEGLLAFHLRNFQYKSMETSPEAF